MLLTIQKLMVDSIMCPLVSYLNYWANSSWAELSTFTSLSLFFHTGRISRDTPCGFFCLNSCEIVVQNRKPLGWGWFHLICSPKFNFLTWAWSRFTFFSGRRKKILFFIALAQEYRSHWPSTQPPDLGPWRSRSPGRWTSTAFALVAFWVPAKIQQISSLFWNSQSCINVPSIRFCCF